MRPLVTYFAMAFCISWGGILLFTRERGLPDPGNPPAALGFSLFLCMLAGPSLSSLALTAWFDGRAGLRDLGNRIRRWRGPHAPLLVAPVALCGVLLALSLVDRAFLPWPPNVPFALIAGLGAGFFEELGWTGYATPRMLERLGVIRTGLLLGFLWALWHLLADYWGGIGYGALWAPHFLQWFVALIAFRLLMTWVYHRAHSVLLGMAMHATFTGSQALLWPAATPAQELLWYGLFGVVLWIVAAAVVLRRARLEPA